MSENKEPAEYKSKVEQFFSSDLPLYANSILDQMEEISKELEVQKSLKAILQAYETFEKDAEHQ